MIVKKSFIQKFGRKTCLKREKKLNRKTAVCFPVFLSSIRRNIYGTCFPLIGIEIL